MTIKFPDSSEKKQGHVGAAPLQTYTQNSPELATAWPQEAEIIWRKNPEDAEQGNEMRRGRASSSCIKHSWTWLILRSEKEGGHAGAAPFQIHKFSRVNEDETSRHLVDNKVNKHYLGITTYLSIFNTWTTSAIYQISGHTTCIMSGKKT